MAARINVKLLGMEGIQARLKQMSDTAAGDALESSIKAAAEVLRDLEIARSPQKTGRLKAGYSIQTISKARSRVRMGLFMSKEAFYWKFLEFGKRITGKAWIRKVFKPKRAYLRIVVRDTFRDRMQGFLD